MARREPRPYWHPYVGALVLGLVLGVSFLLTGHGLGNSGGVGRLVVAAQDLIAPESVNTNPYLGPTAGAENNPFEHWIMWAILGALLGGFTSDLIGGRLGFEVRKVPTSRWGNGSSSPPWAESWWATAHVSHAGAHRDRLSRAARC